MNLIKKIFISVFVCFLFFQISFADSIKNILEDENNSVSINDTFTITVTAENSDINSSEKINTIPVNLKYDPDFFEYVSSAVLPEWILVDDQSLKITDTKNGIIKRVLGYPAQLINPRQILKYTFKAKKIGNTDIKISSENDAKTFFGQDLFVGNIKNINIVNSELGLNAVNFNLNLKVKPDNDIYKQNPYSIYVFQLKQSQDQDAITKVWVFDSKTNVGFEEEAHWKTGSDNALIFTIPADTLAEGRYKIIAKSRYGDGKEEIVAEKDIEVLSNGENWFTNNKFILLPIFFVLAFAGLLHHIFSDMEIYLKLINLRKNFKKLSKKNLKKK